MTRYWNSDEVFLSFLPLSHSYEHMAGQYFPISIGAQIYYAEGLEHLSRNMAESRPTIMTAVPRLYEVMHGRIVQGVEKAGGAKAKLFNKAVELGRKEYENPGSLTVSEKFVNSLLDRLVRKKVAANFGGRLKALVSGGAPLNYEIGTFFTALGLRLLQGYGLTETAPLISVNRPKRIKLQTVGPPVVNTEVRIADDGEIVVRGELVMQGYWRNPDATDEMIKDGWLHTGDVGRVDEDGCIEITDRKKDIIVNSGGDTISPQRIEGFLALQPEIAQAMVSGDKRPYLVALVVPDADFAADWARSNGKPGGLASLVEDPEFRGVIAAAIERTNQSLSSIEHIRRFLMAAEPFTIENEMMTPSLKVRRHKVNAVWGEKMAALYGR
jgi:long-chain acyl-CoA synthetase